MPPRAPATLALALMSICTACAARTPTSTSTPVRPSDTRRASLEYVLYRDNELPPAASPAERHRLARALAAAPTEEADELRKLYGDDTELLVLATRDTDGDGVPDYRVSEYCGKFFEGDLDLDGDGVRNVFDAAPYERARGGVDDDGDGVPDREFADADADGVPDHVDWSEREPAPLPAIQARVLDDFGVLLVARSAGFDQQLAAAVEDNLRYVLRGPLPTLRTVASEDQLLLDPCDEHDNGLAMGQTQSVTIATRSIDGAAPIVVLGLLTHELAHAWQFAQDFDASAPLAENRRMHYPDGEFTRGLAAFGWHASDELAAGYEYRLYVPQFYATSPTYTYIGSTRAQWKVLLDELRGRLGPEFLHEPSLTSLTSLAIVGTNSLVSPWEWHADQILAALYNRLERELDPAQRDAMFAAVQAQWPSFDYRNAAGSHVERELAPRIELSDDEAMLLLERWVEPARVDEPGG